VAERQEEAFMRIHYLQHVPFEDLANMESWASSPAMPSAEPDYFQENGFPLYPALTG